MISPLFPRFKKRGTNDIGIRLPPRKAAHIIPFQTGSAAYKWQKQGWKQEKFARQLVIECPENDDASPASCRTGIICNAARYPCVA